MAPCVNEPIVRDDASPEELAINAFLDSCGISQINVRQQLQ